MPRVEESSRTASGPKSSRSSTRLRSANAQDPSRQPRLLVVVETVSGILEVFAFLTCLSAVQFVETTTSRAAPDHRRVTIFHDGTLVFRRERTGNQWDDAAVV